MTGIPVENPAANPAAFVSLTAALFGSTAIRWTNSGVPYTGELLLENDVLGNAFAIQNNNSLGYSAITTRSVDVAYPAAGGAAYEHSAWGYGDTLSPFGTRGLAYWEISRYDAASNPLVPPPMGSIQTTGGIDPSGGARLLCTTVTGNPVITAPANSVANGSAVTGAGIPTGTTVVSGGGTTSITLSKAVTTGVSGVSLNFAVPQYGQYNCIAVGNGSYPNDYAYGVSVYTYTAGKNIISSAPFFHLDQARGRVQLGTGPFDEKLSLGVAPLNVVDAGTPVFRSVRSGFNTWATDWAASPNRITDKDGNAAAVVFTRYMDGTQRSAFGTPTNEASAAVEIVSTTRGFLPPKMTTTQKNAISSPAEGLVVYDVTLHKLCVRTASGWETITSA